MTVEQAEIIIQLLNNIQNGMLFIITIIGAWFVWMVIKAIYNLFAGVFLGGL